ncbi:MAG: YhcH/YjgK/YiaL family protein [Erysipelotrichaceae bacterium]
MIVTNLTHLPTYYGLHKNLDVAITTLLQIDLHALPFGKTSIDEDRVYLNKMVCNTDEFEHLSFEVHKRYLDIHLILDNDEYFLVCDQNDLVDVSAYQSEQDIYFGKSTQYTTCHLHSQNCVITFPQDAHLPRLRANHDAYTKVVVKVLF